MIIQQGIQTATAGHWQGPISCCLEAPLHCSFSQTLCVRAETKISNPRKPSPSAFSLLVCQKKEYKHHELTKMLLFYNAFAEEQER